MIITLQLDLVFAHSCPVFKWNLWQCKWPKHNSLADICRYGRDLNDQPLNRYRQLDYLWLYALFWSMLMTLTHCFHSLIWEIRLSLSSCRNWAMNLLIWLSSSLELKLGVSWSWETIWIWIIFPALYWKVIAGKSNQLAMPHCIRFDRYQYICQWVGCCLWTVGESDCIGSYLNRNFLFSHCWYKAALSQCMLKSVNTTYVFTEPTNSWIEAVVILNESLECVFTG